MPAHKDPLTIPPWSPSPNPSDACTLIFLHGFGDDAEGWTGLPQQFAQTSKLPSLKTILPNAPHNHDAMAQAWYMPTSFSSSSSDEDDDEKGLLHSVGYLDALVEAELASGTPGPRIVVGGFSQGAAVSLLWALVGRRREHVGGVVALSGYLPLGGRLEGLREERKVDLGEGKGKGKEGPKIFLAHGSKDMMVPRRLYLSAKEKLEGFLGEERIGGNLYEGLGHATGGREIGDLVRWLEALLRVHEEP